MGGIVGPVDRGHHGAPGMRCLSWPRPELPAVGWSKSRSSTKQSSGIPTAHGN
jgi:hypothetical protein